MKPRDGDAHCLKELPMSGLKFLKTLEVAVLTVIGAAMTVVMIANVVMRYCFDSSLVWAEEFIRIGFVWTMFIAVTTGFIRNEHIGFEALMSKTPKTRRLRGLLYGVALAVAGGLMAWYGYIYNGYTGTVPLAGTNLPTAVLLLPGIIAGAAWFCIGLYNIARSGRGLIAGGEE